MCRFKVSKDECEVPENKREKVLFLSHEHDDDNGDDDDDGTLITDNQAG